MFEDRVNDKGAGETDGKAKKNRRFYITAGVFLTVVLAAFIITSNCFVKVTVSGASMEDAFHDGDIVWGSRWKTPEYGSVVMAKNPTYDPDLPEGAGNPKQIFKRAAGFAGDVFYIEDGSLWRLLSGGAPAVWQTNINPEFLALYILRADGSVLKNGVRYTVPEGGVFLLGDNYDVSKDSRMYGAVLLKNILAVIY